jgi:hypothetical protein
MASFDIQIGYDDPDEIRALYQALLRAAGTERVDINRLRSLRGSGYLALSETDVASAASEQGRAEMRLTAITITTMAVRESMRTLNIKPW